ncbi:MAG TPA: alpha/beta hydrolase fold domain-containing protein [Thermoanaerobaculia bacterium]
MYTLCRDRFSLAVCLLILAFLAIGGPASAQSCQTFSGLTYGTYVDATDQPKDLQLELMVPTGATSPVPVVIWVHGGGWSTGSRLPIPSKVSALCARGYAVASIDYRLSNVARWPAQIQDCRGAVRWLRAHAAEYNLDPDRFAAWGDSAGGHLATMLGTAGGVATSTVGNVTVDLEGSTGGNLAYSSRVQAVVDWYGAIDFLQMRFFPAGSHDGASSPESRLIGGPIQDNPEKVATANPIGYATPDDPPVLAMHGTSDTVYHFHQSRILVDALTAQGVDARLRLIENAGHGGSSWWNPASISDAVYAFLDEVLLNGGSASASAQAAETTPAVAASGLPVVTLQATDARALEAGTDSGRFQVSVDAAQITNLTVSYTVSGTAINGADYAALSGSVTIPAGQTSATIDLTPVNDAELETGEMAILTLSASSLYAVGSPATASVSIGDNDLDSTKPIVSAIAGDFAAAEPGLGKNTGTFHVTRTGSTSAALTVDITLAGDAGNGADYAAVPATVTFPVGANRVLVTVDPLDDLANEGTETAALTVDADPAILLGRFDGNAVAVADDEPLLGNLALSSVAVAPAGVTGGQTATGTVQLNGPAPAGGVSVSLASASPSTASVPASVAVPGGTSSATFTITTQPVASSTPVQISATFRLTTRTTTFTVNAPALSGLTLTPASFTGGCKSSTGKVTLIGKAPAGGIVVQLANANPVASVPASVTVPAGATSQTFAITAPAVTSNQVGAVTATLAGISKSGTLTVKSVGLLSLSLSPNPVVGPNPVTGTVTLECAAAPGPVTVSLSSSKTTVAYPGTPSLTIAAGQTTGTFSITTADVSAVSSASIKATANGGSKSVTLTVNP